MKRFLRGGNHPYFEKIKEASIMAKEKKFPDKTKFYRKDSALELTPVE